MAAPPNDAKEAADGKAFYSYLYDKQKPIPSPTPVLDALLRAIALHIVCCELPNYPRRGPGADW